LLSLSSHTQEELKLRLSYRGTQNSSTTLYAQPRDSRDADEFLQMLNDCVRIAVGENVTRLKSFSTNAYSQLAAYTVMSYYKFCAIGKARGILRNYSKARTKNLETKELYARHPQLTTL